MLKIKALPNKKCKIWNKVIHFNQSDLINIIESDGVTCVVLIDKGQPSQTEGVITIYTREKIELSEFNALLEDDCGLKEKLRL